MRYSAVIVAAGSSTRFDGGTNKLLCELADGRKVIEHTLDVFREDEDCAEIVVVTGAEVLQYLVWNYPCYGQLLYCQGGATRQESVYHGLLAASEDFVLVHDGARCYLEAEDLQRLKEHVREDQGAILCKSVTDTVKIVEGPYLKRTVDRTTVKLAQTPQGFPREILTECFHRAVADGFTATDDAQIVEKYGTLKVEWVESFGANTKITYKEDIREDK